MYCFFFFGGAVGGVSLAFKLRGLSPENFVRLLAAVFAAVQVFSVSSFFHYCCMINKVLC